MSDDVEDCFLYGGSLLSMWDPTSPDEVAEMAASVKLAKKLQKRKIDNKESNLSCCKNEDPNEPKVIVGGRPARTVADDPELVELFMGGGISASGDYVGIVAKPVVDITDGHVIDLNDYADEIKIVDKTAFVEEVPTRKENILEEAQRIVTGARRGAYGKPERNFERIADLWNAYLNGKPGGPVPITPQDTALMMVLLKLARLLETPDHRDSHVDIIGYAFCSMDLFDSQI